MLEPHFESLLAVQLKCDKIWHSLSKGDNATVKYVNLKRLTLRM